MPVLSITHNLPHAHETTRFNSAPGYDPRSTRHLLEATRAGPQPRSTSCSVSRPRVRGTCYVPTGEIPRRNGAVPTREHTPMTANPAHARRTEVKAPRSSLRKDRTSGLGGAETEDPRTRPKRKGRAGSMAPRIVRCGAPTPSATPFPWGDSRTPTKSKRPGPLFVPPSGAPLNLEDSSRVRKAIPAALQERAARNVNFTEFRFRFCYCSPIDKIRGTPPPQADPPPSITSEQGIVNAGRPVGAAGVRPAASDPATSAPHGRPALTIPGLQLL